jgi:hypothetical protein
MLSLEAIKRRPRGGDGSHPVDEEGNRHPALARLIDVQHYEMKLEDRAYVQRLRRHGREAARDPERSLEVIEINRSSQNKKIVKLTSN